MIIIKSAKNGPIFKIQVSIYIKIKLYWGVNFINKYQNLVISKCEKFRNKVEVAEEIGGGNELKSLQINGSENEVGFN